MPPTQQIRVLMQLRLLSPVSCLLTLENPCRQPPTPGYPPGYPPKRPCKGRLISSLPQSKRALPEPLPIEPLATAHGGRGEGV